MFRKRYEVRSRMIKDGHDLGISEKFRTAFFARLYCDYLNRNFQSPLYEFYWQKIS